jgi:hypothetical protein
MIPLLLSALLAPPVPPPPADQLEAAIALWDAHPLPEDYIRSVVDGEVDNAAYRSLKEARLRQKDRRWVGAYGRMRGRLAAKVPADRRAVDRQATVCIVDSLARDLSVDEIEEVRRFAATPAGTKFWRSAVFRPDRIRACYSEALSLWPDDSDYRAAGLRPPKSKWKPGEIVS